VSGPIRRRLPWRRVLRLSVPTACALALTATLAVALQVREVRVSGTHRFPASEVDTALRSALGTPTIAARAEELRAIVLRIPWVADATVRISLDGVVSCTVKERVPVAVEVDGGTTMLVDREGHILGPARSGTGLLEIEGFGAFPEERAILLGAVPVFERTWGGRLRRVEWVGPRSVALHFAATAATVIADPSAPESVDAARRVLAAWVAVRGAQPQRLDVRVAGRVAVLPAATPAGAAQGSQEAS
jgi:hypothetical protein